MGEFMVCISYVTILKIRFHFFARYISSKCNAFDVSTARNMRFLNYFNDPIYTVGSLPGISIELYLETLSTGDLDME
jgi:hypothetical protein